MADQLAPNALRVSESRYRRLFETARDGILLLNSDTAQIEDVNPYLIEMLGYSHAEFLGRKLWEVGPFADRAESKEMFAQLQANGYVRYDDPPLKTKAGARVQVEFVSNSYDCEGTKVIQCNIRNITERKTLEAKLERHTRLYAALSQCNKAIVRCVDEAELFPEMCRAAVQFGGMKMAWIGITDTETRMLRPAATFGDDTGYLEDLNLSLDAASPFGHSPTGKAIRDDRPFWCQDFLHEPLTAPWHARAAQAGVAASASLPLHRNGAVVGAFTLYSGEGDSFDESARDLLTEMAADVSFALDNFTREAQRMQTQKEIQRYVEQLKTAVMSTVEVATIISEMRDPYTAGHERRVAGLAVAIGAELALDARAQEGLRVAGYLHDIGKITIPSEILSKPGRISAIEYQLIQGHARASFDVLKAVEWPCPVAEIALQHHERMDGSGYPQGLKGEAILLEARIMAVADVVEAMSALRPYRPAWGIDKALAEIERGRGTAYDAHVADACLRLFREGRYRLPA